MASPADYWSFFLLSGEYGLRSLVPTLTGLVPALLSGGSLGIWAILLLYLGEFIFPWRKHQPKLREGVWLDVFYTFANFFLFYQLIGTPVFQTVELMLRHSLQSALGLQLSPLVSFGALPVWGRAVVLFLVSDLLSYLGHVLLHRSRFLWTFHKVHHSARQLDVLNALRQHWVEKLYYDFFSYIPLALIGFEAQQVLLIKILAQVFCTFTHSNLTVPLGPLRYVINNPQLHLWHHAAEVPPNRNVNYGSALSMWDYLFRTDYLPDDRNDLELGFEGIDDFPTTLWGQQIYPLGRLAKSLETPPLPLRWLGRVVAAVLVVGGLGAVVLGGAVPERVLRVLHVGYRQRASDLLDEGRSEAALDELQRSAFVDHARLEMLQRIARANHEAGFGSEAMPLLLGLGTGDAGVRWRIGTAIVEQLGALETLSEADWQLLRRARANAELLAELEPRQSRSHYLLGRTALLEAKASGAQEPLSMAIVELKTSISLSPGDPRTRPTLEEAVRLRAATMPGD